MGHTQQLAHCREWTPLPLVGNRPPKTNSNIWIRALHRGRGSRQEFFAAVKAKCLGESIPTENFEPTGFLRKISSIDLSYMAGNRNRLNENPSLVVRNKKKNNKKENFKLACKIFDT